MMLKIENNYTKQIQPWWTPDLDYYTLNWYQNSKGVFMKINFIMFLICAAIFSGFNASAQDVGVIAGIRSDSADAKTSGYKVEGKNSFNVGGIAKFELAESWNIRTGFVYTQRFYEIKNGSTSLGESKFTYFEIPVGVLYKFSDFGGAFLGPNLAFNISKDCAGGTCTSANSTPIGLQLGASFKFAPQMGFEFYYETMMSKIEDQIENPKAIVANFMVTFD